MAQEVSGGSEAMIMGFAGRQVLNDLGHIAFLDLGSDDGIAVGDEFVLYGSTSANDVRGSLQVVGLTPSMVVGPDRFDGRRRVQAGRHRPAREEDAVG